MITISAILNDITSSVNLITPKHSSTGYTLWTRYIWYAFYTIH